AQSGLGRGRENIGYQEKGKLSPRGPRKSSWIGSKMATVKPTVTRMAQALPIVARCYPTSYSLGKRKFRGVDFLPPRTGRNLCRFVSVGSFGGIPVRRPAHIPVRNHQ